MDNLQLEKEHLADVILQIQKELDKVETKIEATKQKVLLARRYMWEEMPRLVRDVTDANEMASGLLDLQHQEVGLAFYTKEQKKLERLKYSPYFARIDFRIQDTTEPIYIGITGFSDLENRKNRVYDWRTPIASLFYDYTLGPASYICDAGTVSGEITLKRQFRIEKSQMLYMFDSSLNIEDEMLQEILSQSTDGHMRDIVMTIQREQNQAIRDEAHRLVLVWGAGGSGKTSIALHRIAYLLYRQRDQLKAENIVIFSPSDIFQDYISEVLPDLGEENVNQLTFDNYATKIFSPQGFKIESSFDQYEYIFGNKEDKNWQIRNDAMLFKNSPDFLGILENYLVYLENSYNSVQDFVYNGTVVLSGEEFYSCVKEKYNYLPFKKRLEKLERRLIANLTSLEEKRKDDIIQEMDNKGQSIGYTEKELQKIAYRKAQRETKALKDRMSKLISFDLVKTYLLLFQDLDLLKSLANNNLPSNIEEIAILTRGYFAKKYITQEDLAALAFLRQRLEVFNPETKIRHIVIDEVQDYSAVELKVLAQAFTESTFTVLGDPNQALLYKGEPREYVLEVFNIDDKKEIELVKSYRSTEEITEFAKSFADSPTNIEPVLRKGKKPEVIIGNNNQKRLIALLKELLNSSRKSIAIITKNFKEAIEVSELLKGIITFSLVDKDTYLLPPGVVIIPVFLAKGLEFDIAIVWDFQQYSIEEKRLLYIASTRALHELYLFGTQKGDLLTEVDPQKYHLEID
ncbi:MAG TPA: AAA family ATPase [Firmicutes bacterium]|jgi:DNA helicase-2/ATP-dependent DNA helicase PcrA|nr:AAA family ATPase [Bacillota bacterium]